MKRVLWGCVAWGAASAAWGAELCEFDHISHTFICKDAVSMTPGGAVATVAATDYDSGFLDLASDAIYGQESGTEPATAGTGEATLGVGLTCGWFRDNGNDSSQCTIPLSYTVRNEIDPRRRLTLKLPITRLEYEGFDTTHVGFAAAYTYPLGARWYVTPAVSYTLGYKGDFLAKSDVMSASVTSAYFSKGQGFDVGIGNMLGYSYQVNEKGWADPTQTIAYRGGHNLSLRNGVLLSWPGRLLGEKSYWETSLVLTHFFGDATFTDNQLEVTLSVGNKRSAKVTAGGYRIGLTLVDTDTMWGTKLAVGYWF